MNVDESKGKKKKNKTNGREKERCPEVSPTRQSQRPTKKKYKRAFAAPFQGLPARDTGHSRWRPCRRWNERRVMVASSEGGLQARERKGASKCKRKERTKSESPGTKPSQCKRRRTNFSSRPSLCIRSRLLSCFLPRRGIHRSRYDHCGPSSIQDGIDGAE